MLDPYIHRRGTTCGHPHRLMTLPNLTNRVLIGTADDARLRWIEHGHADQANLPPHNHNVQISARWWRSHSDRDGRSWRRATPTSRFKTGPNPSGEHTHLAVADPHKHDGMEFPGQNSMVIAEVWGGKNKIDGPFNDRNHTSSVAPLRWTAPADVKITVDSNRLGPHPRLEHAVSSPPSRPSPSTGILAHTHEVTSPTVGSAHSVRRPAASPSPSSCTSRTDRGEPGGFPVRPRQPQSYHSRPLHAHGSERRSCPTNRRTTRSIPFYPSSITNGTAVSSGLSARSGCER